MNGLEDGVNGIYSPGQEVGGVEGGSVLEAEVTENGYGYWASYQVLSDTLAEEGELRGRLAFISISVGND